MSMQPPPEPTSPNAGTATAEQPLMPQLGPSRRKRKRRGLWLRRTVALLVLAGLLAGIGMGAGSLLRTLLPPAPLNLGGAAPGESLNILVVGVDPTPVPQDEADDTVRRLADTVLVLSLNYQQHRGFVLAIPRDTRATLGNNGDGALGDALALGHIPLLKDTVEQLTGLTIHHYIWLDMDGAKDLVKLAGGLDEYLTKPIKFSDAHTGLSLDLPAGPARLTPEQTLAYAYYREPGGDLDRLAREQKLISQWQARIRRPLAGLWFGSSVGKAMADITTDLPKADFEALADQWRQVDPRDLSYALMPGEVSAQGEWLMSPARWESLLPRLQAVPGTKAVVDAKPTVDITYSPPPDDKVKNLADNRVMALADDLTKAGFQVLRTARQDVPGDETLIVDRTRADQRSQPVIQALDAAVKGGRVVVDPGDINGYGSQYTLKLGDNFFQ